jgi:type VI secretion system protein ImpK
MARVHNTSHPPDTGDLREWTVRQLRVFEQEATARGIGPDLLRPAHYALCISLDDVVLGTPWGATGSWRAQPLATAFHREPPGQERFFELLREMCNNPRRSLPVIKLMYLCLSLGFLGRYRAQGRAADIKRIRDELHAIIVRQQKTPEAAELSPHVRGVQAPHRVRRARLPIWVAASAGLGLVALLYAWFALSINAESDALQVRARDAPPSRMPAIARAAFVDPPPVARPAPPPEPTALDRVRQALRPDIEQGLVEVGGAAAQPVIRVPAGTMFASGGAALPDRVKPLLTRIGQALKAEPGQVRVIGYTDDQLTRTVAFPSTLHLSAARAQVAGAVIAAGLGDPARLITEGRGDADPIAANTTAEGRERNRRLEIVLSRQGGP